MELLHSYISSSENWAEPLVLGFCSHFMKTKKSLWLVLDELKKKRLENEWFCKHNFSLLTDGRDGEQVEKV